MCVYVKRERESERERERNDALMYSSTYVTIILIVY